MKYIKSETEFVVTPQLTVTCIKNDEYPVSLEIGKTYQEILDDEAIKLQLIRVIDESGEDYLYPQDYFIPSSSPSGQVEALTMRKQVVSVPVNASALSPKQRKH